MSIISLVKGKLKQREVRKLEPDKDFNFDENYYATDILDGFNFIYCNNYTNKFCSNNNLKLSFISCVISLPSELKVIANLSNIINEVFNSKDYHSYFEYNNLYVVLGLDRVQLFLRGDINFYRNICDNIHNNIFTKYIRNNIFPNELNIETPNEYLDNMYNSINCPTKELDILFIEDKVLCKGFNPVIGLSISNKNNKFDSYIKDKNVILENNRCIIYKELNTLSDEEVEYLVNNVKHGDKLLELLHKGIDNEYDYSIDEIIE